MSSRLITAAGAKPMDSKYSDAVEAINAMASVKMTMNSHKGAIEDTAPLTLMELLHDEVDELRQAVNVGDSELMHIIEEAADVQNFLIAIVHQQIQKYRTRK